MARSLPGANLSLPYLADLDMDRLGRDALRLYLEKRLQEIDARIDVLIQAQSQAPWMALERAAWAQPAAAEVVWDGILEMDYLHAMREAVIEVLTTL